jgi:chitinase
VKPYRTRLLAAVAIAALLPVSFLASFSAPAPAVAASGAYGVAPYVDMTTSSETLLDTAATTIGLHYYTAAFVLGEGCSQIWATTYPVGADPIIDPEISRAKSEGATPIISYGGSAGIPLAWSCTTQSAIQSGYQTLINDYGVTWLDFDVEGAAIADQAAGTRNALAMKAIKASNSNIKFSMTMPVLPTGLTQDGVNQLISAKNAGVKIDVVNIMTMDYYQGTGTEMGQAAISAAQATLAQMKSVDSSYTYANLGITPMIGVNDDHSVFTLADASTVTSWANSNGVARLSFWSLSRDQGGCNGSVSPTCSGVSQNALDFTRAFGGGGGPIITPPPTGTPVRTASPTPVRTASPTPVRTASPTPVVTPPPGGGVVNPGFETGAMSPWTGAGDSVVTGQAHTGTYALAVNATASSTGQAQQVIGVSPNHTYTLSAWVKGSYSFIGVTGTGTSDVSTWTSSAGYSQLKVTFTTGASTSSVTVWVHGWYGQGTVYADDFAVA